MKKFLVFFVVCFSLHWQFAYCQNLYIDSTRFITGTKVGTSSNYTIPTKDKGFLFTGMVYGNPGGIIPYIPIDTGFNGNVLVGKIDSNQQISWIKVYGGSDAEGAGSSCQTPDGGYAVLAGTASNNGDITGFKGITDLWLLRLDGAGNLLWQKCYGSPFQDWGISIATTPDHGFIILGGSYGTGGDVPFHYGSIWQGDWLVIKTDSVGNVQWSKTIGGSDDDGVGSILSIDSSFYIACGSFSKDYDCTDTAWHAGVNTNVDYHVLKLDWSGNVLWDHSYGGTGLDGPFQAMFDTRDSTIVMVGKTNSVDYMVTGFHFCSPLGNNDMWVIKVNKSGTLLWQKTLGSIQDETGNSICMSHKGGYMVYGETFQSPCDDTAVKNIGSHECWVLELDNSGNIIADKVFGGTDADDATSIIPYLTGYVAAGSSASSVFTEGICNTNYSGAYISYIGYSSLDVKNIVGVSEPMQVYPNPTHNVVKILVPSADKGKISVSNILGQTVYTGSILSQNNVTEINTGGWATGMYLVQWRSDEGQMLSARLIKN